MSRRTVYASALLALSLATFAATMPAQESLGDAARRIRAKKGDEPSSATSRTAATPQPATPAAAAATGHVPTERPTAAIEARRKSQRKRKPT